MSETDDVKIEGLPPGSPLQPNELKADSEFQFNCHKGIACFNACCKNIDIILTPYDILRLKRNQGLKSHELVARYTLPFEMDFHGLPGLKLATKPGSSECAFLSEEGCGVYADRPAACRYYALGNMGVRKKDESWVEDIYFVVKEDHCLGHQEPVTQTVAEYRHAQGVDQYDDINREWRDLIIKKRSAGPTVGRPSERSMQLFDMCSYDMDSFREFLRSEGFTSLFAIPEQTYQELLDDEDKLLRFSFQFLKQVLFGEATIPMREEARDQRVKARRPVWARRREEEIGDYREEQEAIKEVDSLQYRAEADKD